MNPKESKEKKGNVKEHGPLSRVSDSHTFNLAFLGNKENIQTGKLPHCFLSHIHSNCQELMHIKDTRF